MKKYRAIITKEKIDELVKELREKEVSTQGPIGLLTQPGLAMEAVRILARYIGSLKEAQVFLEIIEQSEDYKDIAIFLHMALKTTVNTRPDGADDYLLLTFFDKLTISAKNNNAIRSKVQDYRMVFHISDEKEIADRLLKLFHVSLLREAAILNHALQDLLGGDTQSPRNAFCWLSLLEIDKIRYAPFLNEQEKVSSHGYMSV